MLLLLMILIPTLLLICIPLVFSLLKKIKDTKKSFNYNNKNNVFVKNDLVKEINIKKDDLYSQMKSLDSCQPLKIDAKKEEYLEIDINKEEIVKPQENKKDKKKKKEEEIKFGKYANLTEKEIFSRNGGRPGPGPSRGPRGGLQFKEKPKNFSSTLFRMFKYIGSNKTYLIILMVAVIASTIISLSAPVLQGNAINAIKAYDMNKMVSILIALFSVYVASALIECISSLISAHLSQNMVKKMRKDVFGKISYLPISYFDTHQHGDIMSKVTNDVDNISNTVSQSLTSLISGVITVIGALVIMLIYSPLLTLISVMTLSLTLVSSKLLSSKMRKFFRIQRSLIGEINAQVEEMVVGHKTVKSYCKEQDVEDEFNEISNNLRKYGFKAELFGGVMGPMMNIINNFSYLLVVAFGAIFVANGINGLEVGAIITFASLSRQFSRPINTIANLYTQIQTSMAAAERVFEILDTPEEVNEGKLKVEDIDQNQIIEFKNVNFSYVPGSLVLKNFSLTVKPGEKIALVGATGSGKTTVVNLLMRFYDVDSGEILIGGKNINDLEKHELRSLIAIVLQDTVLFKDTILNNIKYGKLDATKDEVVDASKLSNSNYFINRLSNQYDTILTESGSNLSGGQRQLLSIARAVLADPKILILDEATSSVDTRTEKNIQDGLLTLMKNRTSLIIAHRLSTIRDADKIVVIDHGRIVEIGNHNELVKKDGIYAKLYQTQFAGNTI